MLTQETSEVHRYRELRGAVRWLFILFSVIGLGTSVIGVFHLVIAGPMKMAGGYYLLLITAYLPLVFLLFPSRKRARRDVIPWYDYLAAVLACGIALYFSLRIVEIYFRGWEYTAPLLAKIGGLILVVLVLEAARRCAGLVFALLALFFGVFPLFADYLPGLLQGKSFPFWRVVTMVNFGPDGFLGIPMRVIGDLLIGFMIFGIALIHTGGGTFFLKLALAMLGHVRGGPAKVAVVASAFFGTMSGSAAANVIATGSFTIPTMKRIGYPPHFAAAVEATASTGGMIMPPVMGAAAFIMANFLGVPYASIMTAAAIPAILYFLAVFLQVDGRAASIGLKGLPRAECPSLRQTLKEGWFYLAALFYLVWGLIYLRQEAMTPYYATGILLVLAMFRKETRFNLKKFINFVEGTGQFMAEIMAMLLAIGPIIAGLAITGVANAFSYEVIELARGNIAVILLLGFVTSFVLGMGMSATAVYIFLAIVVSPALIRSGFDPFAAHLFVLYTGIIGMITPPVAPAAMIAAAIAGTGYMRVCWQAMRLAIVIYFIPFFFVLEPALLLRGPPLDIVHYILTAVLGVFLIAGGAEGYLAGIGRIRMWARPLLVIAGTLIAFPGWRVEVIGAILAVLTLAFVLGARRIPRLQKALIDKKD